MSVAFGEEELGGGPGGVNAFAFGVCGDLVVFIVNEETLDLGEGTCLLGEVNVFEAECCKGLETVLHRFHNGRCDTKAVSCFILGIAKLTEGAEEDGFFG